MGKLGEKEDEKEEPATERRREYTVFGIDLGEREEQVEKQKCKPGDLDHFCERQRKPASFTNCTFHLSRPPRFRRAFDAAEKNGKFGRIQCQKGKAQLFRCQVLSKPGNQYQWFPTGGPQKIFKGTQKIFGKVDMHKKVFKSFSKKKQSLLKS